MSFNKLKPYMKELDTWTKTEIKTKNIEIVPVLEVKNYLMNMKVREKLTNDEAIEIFNNVYGSKFEMDDHLDICRVQHTTYNCVPYVIPPVKINKDYKR
jgi:predicted nucleic acid-binding protein